MTATLPLLLLDVDGVLNPFAAPACPAGYSEYALFPDEEPVRLRPAHGRWLRDLAIRFDLVWATGWGAEANRVLAPLLGLPELPAIGFPSAPFSPADKLPPIKSYVGRRPFVWIDDALPTEAHAWADRRGIPSLLVSVDPARGLTRPVIERCLSWADSRSPANR